MSEKNKDEIVEELSEIIEPEEETSCEEETCKCGEDAQCSCDENEDIPEVEFIRMDDNGSGAYSKKEEFVQSGKEIFAKSKDAVEDGFKKLQDSENVQKGLDKGKELFEKGVDATVDLTDKTVDYVKNNDNLRDVAVKIGSKVEDVVESENVQKAVDATKDVFQKTVDGVKSFFDKEEN